MMRKRFAGLMSVSLIAAFFIMVSLAFAKPNTLIRDEIPDEYKWDLSQIYPDWEAWQTDLEKIQGMMDRYQQFHGKLAEGPEVILAAYQLSDSLGMLAYKVYQYTSLSLVTDTRNNDIQAKQQQVGIMFARFGQATAWFTPELLKIPYDTMMKWIDNTPELEKYRFDLTETYRLQEHVLDENGEQLLSYFNQFTSVPRQTFSMLSTADVKFPEVTLSDGTKMKATNANYEYARFSLRNQEDREKVFKAHFSTFDDFANTYSAIYNGILQRDWALAQARNYGSTLEADLFSDDIPVEVVENLIKTAKEGTEPLQRYQEIRKKVLGLERYRYFDAYLPLVDVEWPYSYDEIRPMVVESVKIYGKDYQKTVQRAFDEQWIDVYENEGKRSGAFSAGVYGVHPYMLLNFSDTMNDAFTLAHEMGHTMHTMLSQANQPFNTSQYTIFVAEVASMTNEQFFLDYLLKKFKKDPKMRVALLQHAIDDISTGFYRQAMFADYELKAHRAVEQGTPITAQVLQDLYLGSLHDFFGESLDDQDWYKNTWARIPHFFNSPYYVYQYATSKSAASLFYQKMTTGSKKERKQVVNDYLTLLKSGGNDHPIAQLKKAGVDFTTTAPEEALVAKMNKLVNQLEEELVKLGMLQE